MTSQQLTDLGKVPLELDSIMRPGDWIEWSHEAFTPLSELSTFNLEPVSKLSLILRPDGHVKFARAFRTV